MTSTILKVLIILAIFVAVLGATYPIQRQALQEEKAAHYDDKLLLHINGARARYLAAKRYPEKVEELLSAGDDYASALSTQQNFNEAAKIYQEQLMLTWGLVNHGYNEKWANANMHLAGVFRDLDSQSAALTCYETVLEHDRQYLPAKDLRIARDLNNMGLMRYMVGMGKASVPDRLQEFKKSREYLKNALALLEEDRKNNQARIAVSLWNLYLTCRDMGDEEVANKYRNEAQAIDKSLNRVCREP